MTEPADIRLFSDAELQVTKSGQVYQEFENEMDIVAINLRLAKRLADRYKQFWKGDKAKAKVRELIGLPETRAKATIRRKGRLQNDWAQVDKFVFQQPDGMPVPALLFRPPNHGNRRLDAVIIADGRGMTRVMKSTLVRELLNEKTAVFTVDLRGFGETRDAGSNAKYQSHSHRTANVATHIGRPLWWPSRCAVTWSTMSSPAHSAGMTSVIWNSPSRIVSGSNRFGVAWRRVGGSLAGIR